MNNTMSLWSAIACIFAFLVWEHNYSNNTKIIIANVSKTGVESIQKPQYVIDCKKIYDTRYCKAEYLVIPAYKKEKVQIKKTTKIKNNHFDKLAAQKQLESIIIEKENFSAKAYPDGCLVKVRTGHKCPQGKARYSIGYGTIAKSRNEIISKSEGLRRKQEHLKNEVYKYIPENVKDTATYIALADVGYNAGYGAIRDCVNKDGSLNIQHYQRWVNSNGKKSNGLERRRKDLLIFTLGNSI